MAQACTITESFRLGIRKITFSWTSDASGDVNGTTGSTASIEKVTGTIARLVTNPGATAPTDNYDIVLNDEDGADVLGGTGANRDTAVSESLNPNVLVDNVLTLVVSNAGDSKVGTVVLYVVNQ